MSDQKQYCMVMRINVDCNSCCRKIRRIILKIKEIETHLIEKEDYRLIVFGRFKPSDIAIKIRNKMNRRVQILDIEEIMDPDPADQNPPPPSPEQIQAGPNHDNYIPMFPSLEHQYDHQRSLPAGADEYRRFRPDFAVTCFPEPDMAGERFWHYGYEPHSAYNYNHHYYHY